MVRAPAGNEVRRQVLFFCLLLKSRMIDNIYFTKIYFLIVNWERSFQAFHSLDKELRYVKKQDIFDRSSAAVHSGRSSAVCTHGADFY
jgi:archaellum biogenesis protein FlaJ (TadC family)